MKKFKDDLNRVDLNDTGVKPHKFSQLSVSTVLICGYLYLYLWDQPTMDCVNSRFYY